MNSIAKAIVLGGCLAFAAPAFGADPAREATLYKVPQCDCCEGHADYLRKHGFKVTVNPTHDLSLLRRQLGVPAALEGCHLIQTGGYIVEGHVPIDAIERLLNERPAVKGISLPGMPQGSPGMTGRKQAPFIIYELSAGAPRVFAVE